MRCKTFKFSGFVHLCSGAVPGKAGKAAALPRFLEKCINWSFLLTYLHFFSCDTKYVAFIKRKVDAKISLALRA